MQSHNPISQLFVEDIRLSMLQYIIQGDATISHWTYAEQVSVIDCGTDSLMVRSCHSGI